MRHVGRNVDEISRSRFVDELQTVSPAKARAAPHDVDHSLQFAMMMRTGLGIRMHHDRSRPKFLRADSGTRDGFGAGHTGRLWRVGVQFAAANDAQAVVLPVGFFVTLEPVAAKGVASSRVVSNPAVSNRGGEWIVHGLPLMICRSSTTRPS